MSSKGWWKDLDLMRRLYRYDAESGLIYACDRLPKDFYDIGEGSSFVSASGQASKYNIQRSGRVAFNRRFRGARSTCDYLKGSSAYMGVSKNLLAHRDLRQRPLRHCIMYYTLRLQHENFGLRMYRFYGNILRPKKPIPI